MIKQKTLEQTQLENKKVIVRLDLNVPIQDGKITDLERINAALPTLRYLIKQNCKIICLSHLSRIKSIDDKNSGKKSLKIVAEKLKEILASEANVMFCNESVGQTVVDAVASLNPKDILVLENTRYNDVDDNNNVVKKESKNDPELGKFWASLADVFVNDAFGTAHRAHASNVGIASNIADSCLGYLMQTELEHLQKLVNNPQRPFVVLLGGAKVSDKLGVIQQLLNVADKILIGGGMANTFFKAKGMDIGNSKYEPDLIETAKAILNSSHADKIVLPIDEHGANEFANVTPIARDVDQPSPSANYMALDIGPKSVALFSEHLKSAKTIFWNGPVGVFEFDQFAVGTKQLGQAIASLTQQGAYTVIGGGDSAAAANQMGLADSFSFISTGGGASLTFLEGAELPGVKCVKPA